MSEPIKISYTTDPIEVLKKAMRQHGEGQAFILIPSELWGRLVPKGKRH